MNLTKEGDTYNLQGLSVRQLGLLAWMANTTIVSAERMSSLADDARAFQAALDTAETYVIDRIANRIDGYSNYPILDEVVRYAPEDE